MAHKKIREDDDGRKYREDYLRQPNQNENHEGWSELINIITPGTSERRGYGPRAAGIPGQRCVVDLPNEGSSGVYELYARKKPVYIGKSNDVVGRIKQYAYDGSHLQDKINSALDSNSCIDVRFAKCTTPKKAEKAERQYLTKMNYLWNSKLNDGADCD